MATRVERWRPRCGCASGPDREAAPARGRSPPTHNDLVLVGSMAAIGLVVLLTCRDVTIFLIETGLLFQDFSHRVAALAKPAVAFLTFYSMMVIVFACVYRIVAALQVVSGVLLLLFGMQVLMSYARR